MGSINLRKKAEAYLCRSDELNSTAVRRISLQIIIGRFKINRKQTHYTTKLKYS